MADFDNREIKEVEDIVAGDDTFTIPVSDLMSFKGLKSSDFHNTELIKDAIAEYIEDVLRIDYVVDFKYVVEDDLICVYDIEKFSEYFS